MENAMPQELITVIGGSGFLGRHLIKQLCHEGYRVRVICRDTVAAQFLKVNGDVGQIHIEHADITKPDALRGKLDGSYGVVYLPGILYQSGKQTFTRIHRDGAQHAATEAARIGAKRFVLLSALGIENASSRYAKSKLAGEKAVTEAFAHATILRSSLVVGPEDGFFQRFARMNMLAPALPLIAGGHTKFQPVYVCDVAHAITATLNPSTTTKPIYAVAGPNVYSFRELLALLGRITHRRVRFVYLPRPIAMLMGLVCELLPFPPQITRDQVRALKTDSVAGSQLPGLATLGINPTAIETVLPELLARFIKS
jgi:uncharacterized protein YbjT (DUF2867 family)